MSEQCLPTDQLNPMSCFNRYLLPAGVQIHRKLRLMLFTLGRLSHLEEKKSSQSTLLTPSFPGGSFRTLINCLMLTASLVLLYVCDIQLYLPVMFNSLPWSVHFLRCCSTNNNDNLF